MRIFLLPFGSTGWNEKIRIMEEIISSRVRPPLLYNDVLILVPSSRLIRFYDRVFLDTVERLHGSTALVRPDIRTLHQFLQKQFAVLDGPRLIDENSRLVLIEGLVKERLAGTRLFHQSADILAPSLSSAIAKMIEQLSRAGVGPADLAEKVRNAEFCDKPQVLLLLDVYARYEKVMQETKLADPASMHSLLHEHFDPAWFSGYRRIIVDGIHEADRSESGIMKKMAQSAESIFLVHAPSEELLNRSGEFHPLRMVRDFLSKTCARQYPSGLPAASDELYLASALFSSNTFSEIAERAPDPSLFSAKICLHSAVNAREEVSLIAGAVKKSIKNGTPPEGILVAFPSLDEYAPLVERLFAEYGVPYNRSLGRQLSSSAVATAIISLLHAHQEDYSGQSLLRVFSSPFLKFGATPAIAPALDRLMRERKIAGGRLKLLSALRHYRPDEPGEDVLTGPVHDLFTALEPFSAREPAPLSLWMQRLSNLMSWSEIHARTAVIKGALNSNLQAYRKLSETAASLAHAGEIFPDYRYTFHEWFFLLKKTLMHTRFQVPPEDEGGVQILGLEESLALPWKEIYLGGLIDGEFPQRLPQNIFLPEQTLESLGVRTLEHERLKSAYQFYRLLLSADTVTLTFPENQGDKPVVPSPFLAELTPLEKAGLLNREIGKTSGVQFSLRIEDSCSIPELAKAVSAAVNGENSRIPTGTAWLDQVSSAIPGLSAEISAVKSALCVTRPEAGAGSAPVLKRRFSVTELETYINCPYDYYITRVLGIEPVEEVSEDLTVMERGSKVHGILKNFYTAWNKPLTRENRDDARQLLKKLTNSAFAVEADTFRNRRDKERFLDVMAERFLDAEIEFWKQGMKPAWIERKIEGFPLVLSHAETVELSAKIDRIDADENGNIVIVDYKTGKYPQPKMNIDQDIFQLPVYAVMAQQALSSSGKHRDSPLLKPIGLAYYDLAGKSGAGARDVVLFDTEARNDHPSSRPKASPKRFEEFDAILKQSMEKAVKAVEGILAGDFSPVPQDENKCRYCPNEMMCERNES